MSKYLTHFPVKLSFELARGGGALRCAPLGYETAASQALPTGGKFQTIRFSAQRLIAYYSSRVMLYVHRPG